MNYKPRKSKYGKETEFLLEPENPLSLNRIIIKEVPSTFNPSQKQLEEIKEKWEAANMGEDGAKWRYEMHKFSHDENKLLIGVSSIMYSQHFIMRKIKDLKHNEYPTPFTINTLQKSKDDKLLIAVRDLGSDQKGIAAFGSGFCDRYLDKDVKNLPPSHPFAWCMREMLDEGDYASIQPFYTSNTRFLGLIRGSNTDVAGIFYQPLNVFSAQVYLNPKNIAPNKKPEHSELWKLEATPKRLEQFLEEGGMNGAEAADHLLGGVELLIKYWNKLPK